MKKALVLIFIVVAVTTGAAAQTLSVGSPSAHCGQQLTVPVTIDSVSGMLSLEFRVAYDTTQLTSTSVTAGSLTSGFSVSSNASGGVLRVAMASGTPVSGGGTVANLSFNVASNATGNAALTISNILVNDNPRSGGSGAASITCVQPPGAPAPVSPANNATAVPAPVTLSWTAASGAAGYRVNFGTSSPPRPLATASALTQTVSTSPGTRYFWSVQAFNDAGTTDSSVFTFTTAGIACITPSAPQASAPSAMTSGNAFELTWAAVAGATEYAVEESTSPAFASPTSTTTMSTRLSLTRSATSDTVLYFRVRARNTASPCNVDGPVSSVVSVRVVPRAALGAGTRVFPVVGATEGSFGSFFRTSVQLHNPTTQRISGRLIFHAQGAEGSAGDPSLAYSLGAGETTSFGDVIAAMGLSHAIGSLDLVPDGNSAAPLSAVRIFNDGGAAGTAGMTLDQLTLADAVQAGQRGILIGAIRPSAARMNVGIRTLLDGVTMTVTVRAKDGFMIQSTRRTYPQTYLVQVPLSEFTGGSVLLGDEVVTFDVEAGSALIYGAITDNTTQDPSIQIARPITTF